jgi:hypothetical protein
MSRERLRGAGARGRLLKGPSGGRPDWWPSVSAVRTLQSRPSARHRGGPGGARALCPSRGASDRAASLRRCGGGLRPRRARSLSGHDGGNEAVSNWWSGLDPPSPARVGQAVPLRRAGTRDFGSQPACGPSGHPSGGRRHGAIVRLEEALAAVLGALAHHTRVPVGTRPPASRCPQRAQTPGSFHSKGSTHLHGLDGLAPSPSASTTGAAGGGGDSSPRSSRPSSSGSSCTGSNTLPTTCPSLSKRSARSGVSRSDVATSANNSPDSRSNSSRRSSSRPKSARRSNLRI